MKEDALHSSSDVSLSLSSAGLGSSRDSLVTIGLPSSNQNLERQYIREAASAERVDDKVHNGKMENIRFTLHIMHKYNKPKRENKDLSYGAPVLGEGSRSLKPEKSMVTRIVDGVVRPPSSIKLVHSHVRPMHFQNPTASAFCEVLGPSSCRECIEGTNRYTAHKVEDLFFPEIPPHPGTSLVVPKLGHIVARENKRIRIRAAQEKAIPEAAPDHKSKTRERSVTLAIKKNSNKIQNSKTKSVKSEKSVILPVISQGVPTLASNKRGKLKLQLFDRRWEARANDFFHVDDDLHLDRQDSSLHLSEQQKRLRKMLDNIKYKSAVSGAPNQPELES